LVDVRAKAEAAGELVDARVAHQRTIAADDDRRLLRRDPEAAQQSLGVGVVLDVSPLVEHAAARQELLELECPLRPARADELHAHAALLQQAAALQQRAEDDLSAL